MSPRSNVQAMEKRTALIERDTLGGTCLNWGCIPTKSLLRNAEVVRMLREGKTFGFETGKIILDYAAAQRRSREVSARLVKGIAYLMKKSGIAVFKDTAELAARKQVRLKDTDTTITADKNHHRYRLYSCAPALSRLYKIHCAGFQKSA